MKLNYYRICNAFVFIEWRFVFLYVFIFLLFIGLIIRIIYLQLINYDMLLHEGDIRSLRMQKIDTTRGMIRDRVGRLLAVSVPVYAVYVNPKELIKNEHNDFFFDERWKILSDIISVPLNQMISRINFRFNESCVYLSRQISSSVSDYILNLKLPGVYLHQESRRYYPCAKITAHVIGVTDIDGHGIEGVEKSFDSLLKGNPGRRLIRKDRFGRVIENIFSIKGKTANNLFLSIDERLQMLIYHELNSVVNLHKATSGSAILVDVDTGEVLALVNIPSYDPNNLSVATKGSIRNRAISDLFEPGSTVKPIVIMTALKQGVINENSILNTSPYFINGYYIKDVVCHDMLTVKEILQKSSNVGVSRLALSMPSSVLVDAYFKFGIGKKTNLELIGESNNLSFYKNYYSDIEKVTLSYGYGLMVTPLQLARVYATIGSMGVSRPLSIIKQEVVVSGEQIFPPSLVRSVINMLDTKPLFIDSERGINNGHRIAIKTGTVKKVGKYGKYINRYVAYTAGIAPVDHPKFALVVVIDNPQSGQYYGGIVSAPVCRTIMQGVLRIMNIKSKKFFIPSSLVKDEVFLNTYQGS